MGPGTGDSDMTARYPSATPPMQRRTDFVAAADETRRRPASVGSQADLEFAVLLGTMKESVAVARVQRQAMMILKPGSVLEEEEEEDREGVSISGGKNTEISDACPRGVKTGAGAPAVGAPSMHDSKRMSNPNLARMPTAPHQGGVVNSPGGVPDGATSPMAPSGGPPSAAGGAVGVKREQVSQAAKAATPFQHRPVQAPLSASGPGGNLSVNLRDTSSAPNALHQVHCAPTPSPTSATTTHQRTPTQTTPAGISTPGRPPAPHTPTQAQAQNQVGGARITAQPPRQTPPPSLQLTTPPAQNASTKPLPKSNAPSPLGSTAHPPAPTVSDQLHVSTPHRPINASEASKHANTMISAGIQSKPPSPNPTSPRPPDGGRPRAATGTAGSQASGLPVPRSPHMVRALEQGVQTQPSPTQPPAGAQAQAQAGAGAGVGAGSKPRRATASAASATTSVSGRFTLTAVPPGEKTEKIPGGMVGSGTAQHQQRTAGTGGQQQQQPTNIVQGQHQPVAAIAKTASSVSLPALPVVPEGGDGYITTQTQTTPAAFFPPQPAIPSASPHQQHAHTLHTQTYTHAPSITKNQTPSPSSTPVAGGGSVFVSSPVQSVSAPTVGGGGGVQGTGSTFQLAMSRVQSFQQQLSACQQQQERLHQRQDDIFELVRQISTDVSRMQSLHTAQIESLQCMARQQHKLLARIARSLGLDDPAADGGGGDRVGDLVEAVVSLDFEVEALRRENAALKNALKVEPPRISSLSVGATPAGPATAQNSTLAASGQKPASRSVSCSPKITGSHH